MYNMIPNIRSTRQGIGNEIFVQLPDINIYESTNLSADIAIGATSLTVISGSNFAAGYVVIGIPGTERCEIVLLSAASATALTSGATVFAHAQGTQITFIPFNQIELSSATSSGGSFSVASTVGIRADSLETYIQRASDASTLYYKARFKNSNDTTYSEYSDEVSAEGFADNAVGAIKDRALDQLDEEIGGIITHKFLNESLWEGRREIDNSQKLWAWRQAFDEDIGNVVEGAYYVSCPSDLRAPESNQNILGLRIGTRGMNLSYLTKREFDECYEGINHTTCSSATIGATTITIANCRDFDSSGSIVIGANTITYTSKDNSTGILSGVPASGTGSIDTTVSASTDVWQNASFGEPTSYTVWEEKIYFNVPFNSDISGKNIYSDYYRDLVAANSDADIVDEPDYDVLVSYLKYKIKDKKKKGTVDKSKDPDYTDYLIRRKAMIDGNLHKQGVQMSPDIGHLIDEE